VDRLTSIEQELANVVKDINKAVPSPSGYVYYNTVVNTNIDDEVIMVDRGGYPVINIIMDPDETVLSGHQSAYMNEVGFKLVCGVALDSEVEFPRNAINQKMNELLSDIKACISANYHLNETADLTSILRSTRTYKTGGDNYRAGDLIVSLKIQYSQSRLDPNRNCSI